MRALTNAQFLAFAAMWANGVPFDSIRSRFGIRRSEWWRVRSATARAANRAIWHEACHFRVGALRQRRLDELTARVEGWSERNYLFPNGAVQHVRSLRKRAFRRLLRYMRWMDLCESSCARAEEA